MKKKLLLFLSFLATTSYSQDCTDFTAGAKINQNEIQFNALNGTNAFNELNIRTKVGPNGELSMSEYTSLIYSMNIWAGAVDPSGAIKLAAGTYGGIVPSDWSPGPLDIDGQSLTEGCDIFDSTFDLTKDELLEAYSILYDECFVKGYVDCDALPDAVKYWPARGNSFLFEGLSDEISNMRYADFWDDNGNGFYEPCEGDLPFVYPQDCEPSAGCVTEIFDLMPDQLSYWIMNDNSKAHELSNAIALQVEVHNYVLMYNGKRDDQNLLTDGQNNQTVQWQYNIVNKSTDDYVDFHFATWFDYDLGCPEDDYAGVTKNRNSVFVYNKDAIDGITDSNMCNGVNSFNDKVPAFLIDVLRGLSYVSNDGYVTNNGLTSVVFSKNGDEPESATDYYNLMQGLNKDGSDILDPSGEPTKFMFPGDPSDDSQWSMCSIDNQNDYKTTAILSTGPVVIQPGQWNEVRFSFTYSNDETLPCPTLTDLFYRSDIAQGDYDSCNPNMEGPAAPNLISEENGSSFNLVFDNDYPTSNNKDLSFRTENNHTNLQEFYEFEGYKIYQVASVDFDLTQLKNTDLSKLIFQADIQNGAGDLYNYYMGPEALVITDGAFRQMVTGSDLGVPGKLIIDYDYLSQSSLEIGKSYYYVAVAYSKSTYEDIYLPGQGMGERLPYLEGCHNIKVTEVIFTGTSNLYDSFEQYNVSTEVNGFSVSNINTQVTLQLYTINGILVKNWNLTKNETLNQSQLETKLASGIYILNIVSNNGQQQNAYKISIVK